MKRNKCEKYKLEDLLATDSVFVEYFNAFLQLPTFPEPLIFNKESGGFEVHTNAKKELANEIKAAIRAGRRRKVIYRPVHNHSFSAIPLIPIELGPEEVEREINTSFTVKTLNKEQGIGWVKRERLPLFLHSDYYLEYRLAKLVAQAQISHDDVRVKLDYTPRIMTVEEEDEEEEPIDETEAMIRNAYVCMGNAGTTDTEAWVSQAKLTMNTTTTPSNHTARSASAMTSLPFGASTARPLSARSNLSSRNKDSGLWSPTKSSMLYQSSVDYQNLLGGSDDVDDIPLGGDLFDPGPRPPSMPRPSDQVCAVASRKGGRAYIAPPRPASPPRAPSEPAEQTEISSVSTEDLGIEEDHESVSSTEKGDEQPTTKPVVFQNIDDLGNVFVATVLKTAISEITGLSTQDIEKRSEIQKLVENTPQHGKLTITELDNLEIGIKDFNNTSSQKNKKQVESLNLKAEEEDYNGSTPILGANSSDDDSVLNSDDDYEEDLDDFFRKNKSKIVLPTGWKLEEKEQTLKTLKGVTAFQKFLHGTQGERNWHFWLDIERAKLIQDQQELNNFILHMREHYHKPGAVYELSPETKRHLGLLEPTSWSLAKLEAAQTHITEALVLYWAPRFLVKQKIKIKPEKNPLYLQQKVMKPKPDPHPQPHPPVPSALPLRPKSCLPRMRSSQQEQQQQQHQLMVSDVFEDLNKSRESPLLPQLHQSVTTPPVGQKRVYSLPDAFKTGPHKIISASPPSTKPIKKAKARTPRDLLTASLTVKKSRPSSAPVRMGSVNSVREPERVPAPKHAHWEVTSEASSESVPMAQPSANASRRSSVSTDSGISIFEGGRRMEALLQALGNEQKSGGVMRRHLERMNNQLWKNCFDFWLGLQEYHELYYMEVIDPYALMSKAQHLHAKFIVVGAPNNIECNEEIREYIYYHIDPPYEELFDGAEEYVLSVLFEAWSALLADDLVTFDKVELIESKRKLDARSKYLVTLQRRGIIKDRPDTPDMMQGYEDPVYDEALLEKVPAEYQDWTLDKLVHHRLELEHFKQYLAENYASMDLMCWMDIEAFRRIPHSEEKRRDPKAKDIKTKYFTKKYFFGPNSPAGKEGQEKVMQAGGGWGKLLEDRPPTACLLEAQKYVRERLEKNWLPRFLATEEFDERQHPKVGMDDAVEDVMIQRKKKSQAIWRVLESKWVSSSKDIMTFRKALMNPVTSTQFRKYVSIQGENFENDVLFYQEVQRYKDLCHIHSDRSLVQQKTAAILNCFIDSPIPPALQIDITQDMADKLIERKMEATPYLFRESQLTVFRVLFTHWLDFCKFRAKITDEKLTPTLERHRRRARLEEKKKAREAEDKKAREEARRKAMGLPPEADLEDAFNPFERGSDDEDEEETKHDKSSVSWSYSQYVDAFEKEEILNEVDESTFSSLTDRTAPLNDGNESGDRTPQEAGKVQKKLKTGLENTGTQVNEKNKKKVRLNSPKNRSTPSLKVKSPKEPSSPISQPSSLGEKNNGNQQIQSMVLPGKRATPSPPLLKNGGGPRITRKFSKN